MRCRVRVLAAGMFALVLAAGCRPGRENRAAPLRLYLKLAHRQWRHGEKPWYLLQIANVGDRPLIIDDRFWCRQLQLIENSESGRGGTYFQVVAANGRTEEPTFNYGFHGELRFWDNERKGPCAHEPPNVRLDPGETFTASPSEVAPLRTMPGVLETVDLRANPPIPADITGERRNRLTQLWKEMTERMYLFSTPLPGGRLGPMPASIPKGYRVLEGYELLPPGKYKMTAIFEAEPRRFIEEEIRMHGNFSPADVGWPGDMKVFRYQSNPEELEILP